MINMATFRNDMADVINRAAYRGERIILERRGKPAAAIVSLEDVQLLEAMEDAHWLKEALQARQQAKRKGEKPVAWDKARKAMGL